MNQSPSHRMQRISRLLQRRLAELIQGELQDPNLDVVSITHVEVTRDLSIATIFFTTLSDDPVVQEASLRVLSKAAGHLRKKLAADSTWRIFPTLRFKYDHNQSRAQHLADLLQDIAHKQNSKEIKE